MARKNTYDALRLLLENLNQSQISMTFSEIEKVIGRELPPVAYTRNQWWENNSNRHPQAKAWLNAGWRVSHLLLGEQVTFTKTSRSSHNPPDHDGASQGNQPEK